MNKNNPYQHGLDKCAANYSPLTPLGFLQRAASIYPEHTAVIDGEDKKAWAEVGRRCRQFASALNQHGIGKDQTVTILAPNSLACYEAHFGVPMSGAVLSAINTRLDAATIAYILEHGDAKADEKWGETPCAFVGLALGVTLTEQQVIDYCKENLARFKVPRHVVFCELPKTSTGKVQKFRLRELAAKI